MALKYNIKKDKNIKTYVYFNDSKPQEDSNLESIQLLLEQDSSLVLYPNSEDKTSYNSYKNVKNYIYRIITETKFLCKGLNREYIFRSFDDVDAVVIIGSDMDILPNGNVFGFALINFDKSKNAIYIDVICSHIGIKYAGDILISKIEDISRRLFIEKIRLKSVKSAISFYEKYGFTKYDKTCFNMCLMIKSIQRMSPIKSSSKEKSASPIKSKSTLKSKSKKIKSASSRRTVSARNSVSAIKSSSERSPRV